MTRVVTLANLKGGSAKTTSAGYLLHAFAGRGLRPIGVDADPQGSLVRWQGLAGWSVPVVGLPTPQLHRQLWGVVDRDRYDLVVIDTPPLEEAAGIVHAALRVSTDILVTLAPSTMELDRVGPVYRAIVAVADTNPDPRVVALLNRTVTNARSTGMIRQRMTDRGRACLTATVPRLEAYALAFGAPVPDDDPAYRAVAAELLDGAA